MTPGANPTLVHFLQSDNRELQRQLYKNLGLVNFSLFAVNWRDDTQNRGSTFARYFSKTKRNRKLDGFTCLATVPKTTASSTGTASSSRVWMSPSLGMTPWQIAERSDHNMTWYAPSKNTRYPA
jgi:hypothetical protein